MRARQGQEATDHAALRGRNSRSMRFAFSLIELLVVVAVIALLLAIVSTALVRAREAARSLKCMNQLRTVAFQFTEFADARQHTYRGDSERAGNAFRIEDFQEKLYGIDEFWTDDDQNTARLAHGEHPLLCPSETGELQRRKGLPCSGYAVTPVDHVSVGFNMRLDRISTDSYGWLRFKRVTMTPRILDRPDVPLAFDIDGAEAEKRDVLPYYAAPPVDDDDLYAGGQFWFPSKRHLRKTNAAFVGGHVLSSPVPERAAGWNWSYQPDQD